MANLLAKYLIPKPDECLQVKQENNMWGRKIVRNKKNISTGEMDSNPFTYDLASFLYLPDGIVDMDFI